MNIPPVFMALALLAAATLSSQAVTLAVNSHLASTTYNSTTRNNASGASTTQTLPGPGTISATSNVLPQSNLGNGSIEFARATTFATLQASRGNGGSNTVSASATVAYRIEFQLGIGQTANLAFDFNYSLQEAGHNGQITWNLTGPSGAVSGIAGNVGSAGTTNQQLTNQSITTQTASITAPGTYVFNLTGTIPSSIVKNRSVSVSFNSIDLSITTVPEPSAVALGAIGLLLLFQRKRPISA